MADGDDVRDLIPDDERIRLIHIEAGYRIGEKRNFGASQAHGEIIVHWDDDDYSAPQRIADQVARLQTSGKAVTAYTDMLFTNGQSWWRWKCSTIPGSSLCYRKDFWQNHPFHLVQIGEDSDFVKEAKGRDEFISADAGLMMVASIHPGNTVREVRNLSEGYEKLKASPFATELEWACV